MAFTFDIKLPDNTDRATLLASVNEQITKAGGAFSNGAFSVKGVSGTYSIKGNIATITINDKPWYVSNSYLQTAIGKYFGD